MKRAVPPGERGMALLTVLLLVAVMSVLAVSVLDDIRFGVRRTANASEVGQAQWYAIGAEELARVQIRRLAARSGPRTLNVGGWNGREFSFPIEGGLIRARVEDGGNCFDLNSVVDGTSGNLQQPLATDPSIVPLGQRQFQTLLSALGVPSGEAASLGDALVAWMIPDTLGDAAYGRSNPPRLPGHTLLEEVSELRAVEGVTPELYARLRPYVCALPRSATLEGASYRRSPINVNTLREDQAVLVTMLTDGALPPEEARRWLASRPPEGWADANAFLSHRLLVADPPDNAVSIQITNGLRSRFFTLNAVVTYGDAEVAMSSLFEEDTTGATRLAARRWTIDE